MEIFFVNVNEIGERMKKILIVDDDLDLQFLLKNLLKKRGFEITGATNGFDALDFIEENQPEIVLLDIKIPGMNGIEVLKKIMRINSNLPVIMMSSVSNIKQAALAKKLGAISFITKPFDYRKLFETLMKVSNRFTGGKHEKKSIFHHIFFVRNFFKRSQKFYLPI